MNPAPSHTSESPVEAETLTVDVSTEDHHHVVHASGALTASTRNVLFCRCLAPGQLHVIVDMAHVTHFDRDGYAAVVAARRILESEGGSLAFRNLASVADGQALFADGQSPDQSVWAAW
jgi:anti-anti-sigma regulatory factor